MVIDFSKYKNSNAGNEIDIYSETLRECVEYVKSNAVEIVKIKLSERESHLSIVKMAILTYFVNKYIPDDEKWICKDILEGYSDRLLDLINNAEKKATVNYNKKQKEKIVNIKKLTKKGGKE